jgi:glycosyltransferase involved in cell wall biosynthesis
VTGVTVCTPTTLDRKEVLRECIESVATQRVLPTRHIILRDAKNAGPSVMRNLMLRMTNTELVAFLDDDDLMHPDHLEALTDALNESSADLATSWFDTVGAVPLVPRFDQWDSEAEAYMAAGMNVVPVTVVARLDSILEAGGFNPADRWEDYALWMRMLARGARFVVVPRETWTYRMLGGNRTWTG